MVLGAVRYVERFLADITVGSSVILTCGARRMISNGLAQRSFHLGEQPKGSGDMSNNIARDLSLLLYC
jgi:hypothetical protein